MDNGQPGAGTGAPQPTNSGQPLNSADNNQPIRQADSDYTPNPYGDPNGGGFATPPSTGDIILQPDTKQKKRKGLIVGLVCLFLVLIGGGAFATAYIISNQPNNIALSAFNNLMNAKQIKVNGSFDATTSNSNLFGLESLHINFDETAANSNQSTTASAEIKLTNISKPISFELGEVMMSDGIFYLKADGLRTLYYDTFYNQISNYLSESLRSNYRYSFYSQCNNIATSDADLDTCASIYSTGTITPEAEATIQSATDTVMKEIGSIIEKVDGQWIQFSIDDILGSDMLGIDSTTRQRITDSYDCVTDKLTHISNYSSEFSNIYNRNPFLVMTAGQDSFYDVTFDATNLAGYLVAASQSNLVKDLATCSGSTAEISSPEITADDIQPSLKYLPQISAKFNSNFFNHQLSELKINQSSDSFTISSDLNFSYPTDLAVSAPANSRPAMEIIQEVYNHVSTLQSLFYSF